MNLKTSYNFLLSVMRDGNLTPTEKIVYSVMLDCAEQDEGGKIVSKDLRMYDIIAITAMPPKSVERAVKKLVELQYINVENDAKNNIKTIEITNIEHFSEMLETKRFSLNNVDCLTNFKDILSSISAKNEANLGQNSTTFEPKNEQKTSKTRTKREAKTPKNEPKEDAAEPNNNQLIDDFVDKIYKLYPTTCPMRNSPLGKSSKDKERIRRLLKSYSMADIERVVRNEVETKFGKAYMQNFATFLNNFPDPTLIGGNGIGGGVENGDGKKMIINGVEYR